MSAGAPGDGAPGAASPVQAEGALVELVRWAVCGEAGCGGSAISPAGACLAHAAAADLDAHLGQLGTGRPLDGRGVRFDAALLERVAAAAPSTPDHRCVLRRARFDRARFAGDAVFDKVVFEREVTFDGAVFEGHAAFEGAVFHGGARFARTSFEGPARFDSAVLAGHAWFAGADFAGPASFGAARFEGPAWFGRARFCQDAEFDNSSFASGASFDGARFECHSFFRRAVFGDEARFEQAQFARPPRFDSATFRGKGGVPPEACGQAEWSGPALAGWGRRVMAASADAAVVLAPLAVALGVAAVLAKLHYRGTTPAVAAVGMAVAVAAAVRNLAAQGTTGQTVGKRLLGLCLIGESNRLPVGPARSLTRQALHVLDVAPLGLGFLWPLVDTKHQTFADKLLSTVVVTGKGWAGSPGAASAPTGGSDAAGFR